MLLVTARRIERMISIVMKGAVRPLAPEPNKFCEDAGYGSGGRMRKDEEDDWRVGGS